MEIIDYSKLSDDELKEIKRKLRTEVTNLNNKQMSLKILLNSLYGSLANKYSRYFDIRLASAITLSGQLSIRWIEEYLMKHKKQKKYGWKVVYIDTDSLYIHLENVVNEMKKRKSVLTQFQIVDELDSFMKKIIIPIVDKGYQKLADYMGAPENCMKMGIEKICSKVLWVGRKKYAMMVCRNEGVTTPEPQLGVKGIEIVRSSTPKVIRDSLKKAIEFLLTDSDKFYDFIRDYRKIFNKFSPEEIAFPRSINNMEKYIDGESYTKGTPIALRAAFTYNKFIKKYNLQKKYSEIRSGEKIKFLYMKLPNPGFENVFGFLKRLPNEKKLHSFVDYSLQYEKTFLAVIKNICKHIGMDLEKNKKNINNLF